MSEPKGKLSTSCSVGQNIAGSKTGTENRSDLFAKTLIKGIARGAHGSDGVSLFAARQ